MLKRKLIAHQMLLHYGTDILNSAGIQLEAQFIQHGSVNVLAHSIGVAYLCLLIAGFLHLQMDYRSMVRGALLHDYFLYDWHDGDRSHRLHGFKHPERALRNAVRDYDLNEVERDIIQRHMFPLTPCPPATREGAMVCIADKICAVMETFSIPYGEGVLPENEEKN